MLTVNAKIFKAYDIRGVYGQDLDDAFAYQLGLAFVALRKIDPDYQPAEPLCIAVGSDMRLSSPSLKAELIRGLVAGGAEAVDLGQVATSTLYFAVGHYGYQGGIMISASHNPKEWNGFKLVRAQGRPVSGETGLIWMRNEIQAGRLVPSEKPGIVSKNDSALRDEVAYTLTFASPGKIRPLKIVADAANGMGASYLTPLLSALPIKLIPLNFIPDGNFPAHEADPLKEENMRQLQDAVLAEGADLGIATDGDGDRVFFADNLGRTINPAIIRGWLSELFLTLKPQSRIGYDARPGKITVDLIQAAGGEPVITRVGHSLIKEQMLKEDIYFAGESSGHFFLKGAAGCFEYPGIMIIKLLEYFSSLKGDIASHLAPYQKYFHSGEINRTVVDPATVFSAIAARYPDARQNRLDGITIEYPNYWFNVRASNTEAKMRLNLEAVDPATMAAKRDEVLEMMK